MTLIKTMKNNIIITTVSWAYDITNAHMTALRGHKYHILPTSPSPLAISVAILFLLLTFVFSFHGSKILYIEYDLNLQKIINFSHHNIFSFNINNFLLNSSTQTEFYQAIHILWVSPFILTLGIFFLWSSNAIAEGTTTKLIIRDIKKNFFNLLAKVTIEPLFHSNIV
jgi:hypothetical protein